MIKNRLNKLKGVKKPKIWLINYLLCKTFGWDYETLMKQPIPFVFAMIDGMMYEAKQNKKTLGKKKGR